MSQEVFDQILNEIKHYKTIIVHRHKRPDPDALGSQGGLVEILKASFPDKQILKAGGPVDGLQFLSEMDPVTAEDYKNSLVIVTDTANSPRISGDDYTLGEKLIKIDHHPNDEPYGDIVFVNTKASSCSEIIVDFYDYHKAELKLTDEGARLLYAGIVGDTGRFLYPATTSHTLQVAAELMTYNFSATDLNNELNVMSPAVALLSGYVLQNIEVNELGVGRVILTKECLAEFGVADSETAAVVSLPGSIEGVLLWGIFVEQPEGYFRCRLRSKGPVINEIAKRHHGGGHPLASGANAKDLAEVAEIMSEFDEAAKNWNV
ncbi:bifunctional oligoribonuclease/PAP phosphatase NrnA [Carnobacterium maltaromaticum]|jgi:phosphoesterase RecJ-like protein|uniref:DHH family protein n=2 Tax=Carnobacterium TaxID=2747 RepID=K8EI52_CARML|nr:bifunctional oligoribonuclease/PAP phosphatase NrnA [Carnobacterium maltaromaticum]AOA02330.1 oligoribonuclease [Carnobacterium maltaromaticum]KRN85323.1 DHH family protein [Carnobacterium maltaromaticum]MBC9788421.1 bifunctional oligoribonuclease/PAP phosphatase NrnA [Carnobacterium maltaromaticum]MCI1820277.1 bifunctional oligoribonuclease/PAP phosphatase NrnA [Carnobacterium maltaromaticum]MDT1944274.1 bifunctional oligoribonuclease/PAP phosphatase NrnA [Carnobacterium maltaromaticum]